MATADALRLQLEAIDAAVAGNYLRVTYAGRSFEYRSIAELLKARTHVARLLADASGTSVVRSYRFIADKAL
jgi:hypothetical protein